MIKIAGHIKWKYFQIELYFWVVIRKYRTNKLKFEPEIILVADFLCAVSWIEFTINWKLSGRNWKYFTEIEIKLIGLIRSWF